MPHDTIITYGRQDGDFPKMSLSWYLIPGTFEHVTLHSNRDSADLIKLRSLRWEIIVNYLSEHKIIPRILMTVKRIRDRVSRTEARGHRPRNIGSTWSWKGQEQSPRKRCTVANTLMVASWDFCLRNYKIINLCCFRLLNCYMSNRKQGPSPLQPELSPGQIPLIPHSFPLGPEDPSVLLNPDVSSWSTSEKQLTC
jgi:hypothetical protein